LVEILIEGKYPLVFGFTSGGRPLSTEC